MIEYEQDSIFFLIFKLKGSVAVRASYFALPAAIFSFFLVLIDDYQPGFREELGLMDFDKSQLWGASTAVLGILLSFRTNQAMERFWEGTGLLHQMRGEWFDSVSCCVTFSRGGQIDQPEGVRVFRHTLVRLMSLCHGSALAEIAVEDDESIVTIDSFGLNTETLQHLKVCNEENHFNRVEVLLHLIQSLITKGLEDEILMIPSPILSRVYQTLSRGFVNLLNAKKIADTRFPFPYAQLIAMLLLGHLVLTPLMISCLIAHKVWAPLFTFVPIFGMFSLSFIGIELENPFGDDDNDLPLERFQSEMNTCLLMLLHDGADLIASVDEERCIMDFSALERGIQNAPIVRTRRLSKFAEMEEPIGNYIYHSEDAFAPAEAAPEEPEPTASDAAFEPSTPSAPSVLATKSEPKEPFLLSNIEEMNRSLQDWMHMVKGQVVELKECFEAMKQIGDSMPALLDSLPIDGNSRRLALASLYERGSPRVCEKAVRPGGDVADEYVTPLQCELSSRTRTPLVNIFSC